LRTLKTAARRKQGRQVLPERCSELKGLQKALSLELSLDSPSSYRRGVSRILTAAMAANLKP
jgi:hypothetical protein